MLAGERTATSPTAFGSRPVSVLAEDLQLGPGHGQAGRAHAGVAGRVVVLRRQIDHRAGRLGHAVLLDEAAAEHLDALAQQVQRDGRGAVEDVGQAAV
jgi:hypothetical protein